MKAKQIPLSKEIILECFKTDQELLDVWHIEAPNNVEKCSDRTFEDLKKDTSGLKFYKIVDENENLIGFFGNENEQFLTSFFLKPEYRSDSNLKEFWKVCTNSLKRPFLSGIYNKNIRAKKFLEKNGGTIHLQVPDKQCMFLVFREI